MVSLKQIRHHNQIQPIVRVVGGDARAEYAWVEGLEMLYVGELPNGGRVRYPEVEPLLIKANAMRTFEDGQIHVGVARAAALCRRGIPLQVHVNVTPAHLESGRCVAAVAKALDAHPEARPPMLVMEITEATAWKDLRAARVQISALKKLGVKVALDDLGAGRSLELAMVGGFDIVKIDLALTRAAATWPSAKMVAKRLLDLAKDHGAAVIVEGVEREHLSWWMWQGVQRFQSYAFSKPLEDDEGLNSLLDLAPSIPLLPMP